MQTEVCVNYLNCHIHVPSKHVLANREANSRHTYDVTIWLSRTTDNSNIFIRSREVRDNESRLYISSGSMVSEKKIFLGFSYYKSMGANDPWGMASLGPRSLIGRIYVGDH